MSRAAVGVVRGDPVGLMTVLGLAQRGIDVTVLEAAGTAAAAPRPKAHPEPVLDGFERLGLLDELTGIGVRSAGLTFIDQATGEQLPQRIDALDGLVRHPQTLHLGRIGSPDASSTGWPSSPPLRWCWTPRSPTSCSRRPNCWWTRRSCLVGADGAPRTVRRSLGLNFGGFTSPDQFIATSVRYDFKAHGYRDVNRRIHEQFGAIVGKITAGGLWRFTYRKARDLPVESPEERVHGHSPPSCPVRAPTSWPTRPTGCTSGCQLATGEPAGAGRRRHPLARRPASTCPRQPTAIS